MLIPNFSNLGQGMKGKALINCTLWAEKQLFFRKFKN
jgi:hypothetical protein